MHADFFSKPLQGMLFYRLRDLIMNIAPDNPYHSSHRSVLRDTTEGLNKHIDNPAQGCMTPHRAPVSLHARKIYQRTILTIALEMGSCVIHTPNQHHPITRIREYKSYVTTVTSTVRSGVYPTTLPNHRSRGRNYAGVVSIIYHFLMLDDLLISPFRSLLDRGGGCNKYSRWSGVIDKDTIHGGFSGIIIIIIIIHHHHHHLLLILRGIIFGY